MRGLIRAALYPLVLAALGIGVPASSTPAGDVGPRPAPAAAAVAAAGVARDLPMDHDPAAPGIPCDTACHSTSPYRRDEMHRTDACTVCHMKAGDLARERAAIALAQGPTPPAPETGQRRRIEGLLVEDQRAARLRLKGRPMTAPNDAPPAPDRMAYVPAGEFIMGSNTRWDDESPEHVVRLRAFFIDRHEVTNADYQPFVEATGHRRPDHWRGGAAPADLARHPVTYVSWHDATRFCEWAGKRLPSEQEWEKAARGTDGRQYPWGNTFHAERSNNPQKGAKGTEPVGSYESGRSPYGLYDMSGNVWEWVDAWYLPHPGNTVPSDEYGHKYRIEKGGSWFNCLFYNCGISAPSYNRAFLVPETRNSSTGFRCVKDAPDSRGAPR